MKFEHVVTKILDLRSRRVYFWPPDIRKGEDHACLELIRLSWGEPFAYFLSKTHCTRVYDIIFRKTNSYPG